MKPVDVLLKKLEVTDCDAKAQTVDLRLVFSDGGKGYKGIVRTGTKIEDSLKLAESLFKEVRDKLKARHQENASGGEGPLAGVVLIRIKGDEELIIERMAKFLQSVKEKLRIGVKHKQSYYQTEKGIKGLKTDLI